MPKVRIFNNRKVLEPGGYTQTRGGDERSPDSVSFGKVMIIDTGTGAGWGGGSGVNGEKFQTKKSIYKFTDLTDVRDWLRGGLLYEIVGRVFKPSKNPQIKGCDELIIISAKESTPSKISYTFGTPSTPATATIQTVVYTAVAEGAAGNGIVIAFDGVKTIATVLAELQAAGTPVTSNAADTSAVPAIGTGTTASGVTGKGGKIDVKTYAEGIGANGIKNLTSGDLVKGFGAKMIAGINDSTKFIIQFYVGTFTGLNEEGTPYNNILEVDSKSKLLSQSDEFSTFDELTYWMNNNAEFNYEFYISSSTKYGTGVVEAADLTANSGWKLSTGGTESYNPTDLDDVLDSIAEEDNTFFLCDKYGVVSGSGVENTKIWSHINDEAIFEKFMVVGGGNGAAQFDQSSNSSVALAKHFNTSRVYVVHSDILQNRFNGIGQRRLSTLHHAASIVGRFAGLAPQMPTTWKDIDVDGVQHDLNLKQRNVALKAGLIHLKEMDGVFVVNQDVNTMQLNTQMIYPDGQSPEGSVMRISAILNKYLKLNLERRAVGSNTNLASPADVKTYLEKLLTDVVANKTTDNLILKYFGIKVGLSNGDYDIEYGYETNGPINRVFITGFVFSPKVNA